MIRINQADLEAVLKRINKQAGFITVDGNDKGGQSDITNGFVSKRELYGLMHSYLRGMEAKSI